jgi:FKBP-type peptidyl-prolyl cis-trans isomerase FklB
MGLGEGSGRIKRPNPIDDFDHMLAATGKDMAYTRWLVSGLPLIAAFAVQAQGRTAPSSPQSAPVKADKYKLSYAIGYRVGWQLSSGELPAGVDINVVRKAMEDAYAKRAPAVPKEDMYEQLAGLGEQIHGNAVSEFNQIAVDNARKSAEFMTRNATQPGVVQLPSGIQYSVIKKGDGTVNPDDHSIVTINYRAMLIDGTEFDNTWAHGRPVSFTVGSVISGWRYVIPRMHVGDRWTVVVPPILAFGEQGLLPRIGPNQALVFDLELLDVKPPNPQVVAPQPDITK